ncbi:MAG TPA: creatininase family protein [Candidatus Acidoferrum sp.]|nr:creatininase family protein [Candidatus Acidoferrum sp.]
MRTRQLELLRPDEILDEMRRCPVVYLPLGPLEWHGPHLPYGTDPLYASEIALQVADRLGGIVHPCLFLGTERERDPATLRNLGFSESEWIVGMDFPKNNLPSPYIPEEVLGIVVRHLVYQLQRMGFRHVVLVNGHGGRNHVALLRRLCAEISAEGRGRVHYAFTFPEGAGSWSRRHHASTDETAVMRHLFPGSVDTDALPPKGQPIRARDFAVVDEEAFEGRTLPEGYIREDPRSATSALGEKHLTAAVDAIVEALARLIREPVRK